ncbi:uncharacterized protein LOC129226437 [Uloborus diversus]|uniref:uncharacterized protein LOC129226437 n=1 Tax=Uloborus diversus TaxID=327109 RepID=UPI00240A999E|nr:uncharacterized protein LOC129226437 [Uloborus diversus]
MKMHCNNFSKLSPTFGFLFCFGLCMLGNVSASSYNVDEAYRFYFDCFFDIVCERKVPLLFKDCVSKLDNKTKEVIYELLMQAAPPGKEHLCVMDVYWSNELALKLANELACNFTKEDLEALSEIFAGPLIQHFSKVCSNLDGLQECEKLDEYNVCFHSLVEESMVDGYCKSKDKSMFNFAK